MSEFVRADNLRTIAIVGRPNVGKSSLFNLVVGRRLSIVHEMPGVTRDRVGAIASWHNRRFQLLDTGGLGMLAGEKRKVDRFDQHIAQQVELAIEEADVLIFVVNVQDGVTPLDKDVAMRLRETGKPVLLAVNRCDNAELTAASDEFAELGFDPFYPISCLHRRNIGDLLSNATEMLPGEAEIDLTTRRKRRKQQLQEEEETQEEAKPFQVAVVGRPNVGKSSIINAVLGDERVMVSEVAGTTRDAVDVSFTLKGNEGELPAVLIDTAGLRRKGKVDTVVEYFSMMRTETAIKRADLVIFVVEADLGGVTAQDRKIARMLEDAGCACVIAANKVDLQWGDHTEKDLDAELRHSLPLLSYAPIIFTSATHKRNLDKLMTAVAGILEQLESKFSTGLVNRVLSDAFERVTAPVIGPSPLRMYYASMTSSTPPEFLLFVNNPDYCAPNYLAYLRNTLREAFDFPGQPIRVKLKARPKKMDSFFTASRTPRKPRDRKRR